MGLYDTVELEDGLTLPDYPNEAPDPSSIAWQTKDFGWPCLDRFRITNGGALFKEEWHCEAVEPEDRPYAGRADVDEDDLRYVVGMSNRVHDGWEPREDYHGRFRIVASVDALDSLLKYRVTFTHGVLEGFDRVE